MRARVLIGVGLAVLFGGGCRREARILEIPRVDLQTTGNRGYLLGTPPPATAKKSTRTIFEITVELDDTGRAQRRTVQAPQATVAQAPALIAAPYAPPATPKTQALIKDTGQRTYVVQEGDSLWSIAGKQAVFGTSTRWRDLFEANRDQMQTPDDLHAGMILRIPNDQAPSNPYKGQQHK